jgi:hypothetical protein
VTVRVPVVAPFVRPYQSSSKPLPTLNRATVARSSPRGSPIHSYFASSNNHVRRSPSP